MMAQPTQGTHMYCTKSVLAKIIFILNRTSVSQTPGSEEVDLAPPRALVHEAPKRP